MKETIILKDQTSEEQINWDTAQWLINKKQDKIILSSGFHNQATFHGVCLPCSEYMAGRDSQGWVKAEFTPIKEALTIKIQN